jgi:diguanylate cyclase (GGDEF)-like protein/hemerythrin-like metal-binding protein/PAS domain S-box-containing protein
VLIEDRFPPVVFASKSLAENAITIYVHSSLSELVRFDSEKYWLFFLLASAGSMLIVAVSAVVIFLRESQKLNTELRIAASAFESEEGVLITDANNEILRVNRAFTVITGYSAEDAIGKTPRMLSSGKHNSDFFAAMWRLILQTGTWEGELWNRRKGGDEYPEHLIITAVKAKNGQVTNYVATFNDITKRIQAETALQQSHQQMYSLLNSMAEGAYGVDINGNCTFVNRAFLRILGYDREDEIIGRHIHELIHHSHPDGSNYPALECRMYQAYRRNEEIHVSDEVFWTRDGVAVPVEYWSQPILINDVMQGAIATFIDVTERKKLEYALKESELCYRTVADFTSDWEYWILPDNTFRYISPACEQISGYTPEEFYADPSLLIDVVHPDDLPRYTGHVHHISEIGVAEPIDFRIQTKSGEIRWISHVCRPVYDASGHYLGQRAGNRDISDRKAAEEQIRNLAFYDTLTQLPNRRLLNDRLERAMANSRRSGRYGALMFLDLDNFKPINDKYGHGVGDLLLIEVAERLRRCVREIDTVARFGGDEFVVMLSKLDEDKAASTAQAAAVAEKIRVLLAEPYIFNIRQDGQPESTVEHHCTSSIGVVLFINHEYSMEDLCKWADMAMYQAKDDGRNSIRFFDQKSVKYAGQDAIALHLNWHAVYECGQHTIDQEHRKLFDLANVLIEKGFSREDDPHSFELALEELLAHVVQHFKDEEAILAQNHYADLNEHVRAHKALVTRALQIHSKVLDGGVTIGELVSFLADEVVAQHMLKVDRKFFPLFNETKLS